MSWWFKVPAAFGMRPEMMDVGWPGMCAWLALMSVDAQNDFGGRIPVRYCSPRYLARQLPDDGPGAETMARGFTACIDAELLEQDGDTVIVASWLYEEWRSPKSDKQRQQAKRQSVSADTNVTRRHAPSRAVTDVTLPDQTRPDQTRPEASPPGGGDSPARTHEASLTPKPTRSVHVENPEPLPEDPMPSAEPVRVPGLALASHEAAQEPRGGPEPPGDTPAPARTRKHPTQGRPAIRPDAELLACDEVLPRGPERDRVTELLWERQEAARQRVVPGAPRLKFSRIPGGNSNQVILALAEHSPADLCRALDAREAEAECLRERGDDALRYLNGVTNWRPENLRHAVATTPEAMRTRMAAKATGPPRGRNEPQPRKLRLIADN